MYVGQTRNLRNRIKQHGGRASRHNQAVFAFNLARLEAQARGLQLNGTRRQLENNVQFLELFRLSRERVAGMTVRFVEVTDPELRTVFEVYAAVALDTLKHNSFETH
jgi:hypothetical protein